MAAGFKQAVLEFEANSRRAFQGGRGEGLAGRNLRLDADR
jgi:hypothetical protein